MEPIVNWKGGDVLGLISVSPVYLALIMCEPNGRDEVSKVACPSVKSLIPFSIGVDPYMKIILPEGNFVPCDVVFTLAISVIGFPIKD